MKIERSVDVSIKSGLSTKPESEQQPAKASQGTGASSSGSSASVSDQTVFAKQGAAALSEIVTPESAHVEELRAAIEAGEFSVDTEQLALSMSKHFLSE